MYGLTMIKDYLDEILEGLKTFDVRSYPTNKKETIALVDSKTMKVYGTVELIRCREISVKEYADWHRTGRWTNCFIQVDLNKKYYAYDFKNPRKIANPFKLGCEKSTWVIIPKEIKLYYQESLF